MAKRQRNVEYFTQTIRGKEVVTLDAKLYAPDGSIFKMPYGGDVTTYIAKGYLLKPDTKWQKKHEQHEADKAASLEISNAQREIDNRRKAAAIKRQQLDMRAEMLSLNKSMEEEEARLDELEAELEQAANLKVTATDDAEPEEEPEPEQPKAKVKAKAKAKPAKAKP